MIGTVKVVHSIYVDVWARVDCMCGCARFVGARAHSVCVVVHTKYVCFLKKAPNVLNIYFLWV